MKRQILCKNCGEKFKKLFPIKSPYPGEYVKFITGKALNDYLCDYCSINIKKSDECIAHSIWADYDEQSYYKWEDKFIEII